jgi:hypothetical protein
LYRPSAKDLKRHNAGIKLYGVTFNNNAASHSATLKFFVPYSSLPPDVVKRLRALPPTAASANPARATFKLVSYQYFPVGYLSEGQDGAPASSGGGEQGLWTTFVNESLEAGAEPGAANAFFPNDPEAGENFVEAFSALKDTNEALTLNQEDSEIMAELIALENCAQNQSQGPLNSQQIQSKVDDFGSDAREDVGMQFLALLAKVLSGLLPAPENAVMDILEDAFFATVAQGFSAYAAQQLQDDLKSLRSLLPQCVANSWQGDFEMTSAHPPIGMTSSWSGTMLFTVIAGEIKGTVFGVFKLSTDMHDFRLNCNSETAYTGQLSGKTAMQPPDYMASTFVTPSPTQVPGNGTMFAGTREAHPCGGSGKLNSFPIPMKLIDGKPYTLDVCTTQSNPDASCDNPPAPLIKIFKYTVTVHKVFTD